MSQGPAPIPIRSTPDLDLIPIRTRISAQPALALLLSIFLETPLHSLLASIRAGRVSAQPGPAEEALLPLVRRPATCGVTRRRQRHRARGRARRADT
jgi:hypothetical protein